jgi:hypothetical protein
VKGKMPNITAQKEYASGEKWQRKIILNPDLA